MLLLFLLRCYCSCVATVISVNTVDLGVTRYNYYLQIFIEIPKIFFIVCIYDQTMNVERKKSIFNYDDFTKNSTQDCPSVQVYHDHDISSNLHNKKNKKLYEPLNDFDFEKNNECDTKTYQVKVWEPTDK